MIDTNMMSDSKPKGCCDTKSAHPIAPAEPAHGSWQEEAKDEEKMIIKSMLYAEERIVPQIGYVCGARA